MPTTVTQARVLLRYVVGLLHSGALLEQLIGEELAEAVRLTSGLVVGVHTGNIGSPRGRTFVADECAFWSSEDSAAHPGAEVVAAVRPGLASIPCSMLLQASSPYARRGILRELYRRHHGRNGARTLVWRTPTLTMKPALGRGVIAAAYEEDPASAAAEYGAEFRTDVESYISREVVDCCTVPGRHELPYRQEYSYCAFADLSGGSADSFTIAIDHVEQRDGEDLMVLDVVREVRPPSSPEAVVGDYCRVLDRYQVLQVVGDRYGGEWPAEQFAKVGARYEASEKTKGGLYRELLPLMNSHRVELLVLPACKRSCAG